METVDKLVAKVLTEIKEPQTQKPSVNTTEWAKWLEFSIDGDAETTAQLKAMVDAAATFIKALRNEAAPHWLSFIGTSGAGKTYLARRIWNWYQNERSLFRASIVEGEIAYPGSFNSWPKIAGELLSNQNYWKLEEMQRDKLIVLDEIGADRDPSGHVRDCLARVLSGRVGKWTVITSNKSLGDIQRDIDTRISSRMIRDGNVVVDVDVLDYALRTAAQ